MTRRSKTEKLVSEADHPYVQTSIDLDCFDTLICDANFASPSATAFASLEDPVDIRQPDRCSTLSIPYSDAASYDLPDGESSSVALSNNSILCNSPALGELDFTGVQYVESDTPTDISPPTLVRHSSARESRVMGLQELHQIRECLWKSLTNASLSPEFDQSPLASAEDREADEQKEDDDADASFIAHLPPSQHRFLSSVSRSHSESSDKFIDVSGRASATHSDCSTLSSTFTVSGEFPCALPLALKTSARRHSPMSKPSSNMLMPRESVAVLIDAVRASSLQDDDKSRFVFDLFDVDEQGVLSRERVAAFVEATLLANNLKTNGDFKINEMVDRLFANSSNPDHMNYKEFRRVFNQALRGPTDATATTAVPAQPFRPQADTYRAEARSESHSTGQFRARPSEYKPSIHYRPSLVAERKQNFWQREILARYHKYPAEIHWLGFYVAVLLAAYIIKASCVPEDPVAGSALAVAKGSSQVVLVNACFLLLPMCRTVVTYLRQFGSIISRVPVDKHISFHKICGVVMLVSSLIHVIAWGVIFHRIQAAPEEDWLQSRYVKTLGFVRQETLWELLGHLPMWTGSAMLVIAAVAAPLTHAKIRRGRFTTFWLTHLMFVPFLLLLLIHGLAMWVQTSQAFLWVLPPLVLYVVEKRYRMAKVFGGHTSITRVEFLHDTLAIFMKKPTDFHFHPGMFVYLNVPDISRFEWHPYTISSAPEDECLSVHVRITNDWTDALHKLLGAISDQRRDSATLDLEADLPGGHMSPFPPVCIDGPIGTPSQDYFRYQSVVFVGAGADGVTPFASILRSIVHQWESFKCPCCEAVAFPRKFQIQKIYFYWVTREHESITWFTEFMDQLAELDTEGRLEIHNYFTHEPVDAPQRVPQQTFIVDAENQQSTTSGGSATRQLAHVGRPDWKRELQRIANEQQERSNAQKRREREAQHEQPPGAPSQRLDPFSIDASCNSNDVAVFFSGPAAMSRTIHDECARYNLHQRAHNALGVTFDFRRESFY